MIEVEIYAEGLREGDNIMRLGYAVESFPDIRYKADRSHDLVYFEILKPNIISLHELMAMFTDLGLSPRLVGAEPEGLNKGRITQRIH